MRIELCLVVTSSEATRSNDVCLSHLSSNSSSHRGRSAYLARRQPVATNPAFKIYSRNSVFRKSLDFENQRDHLRNQEILDTAKKLINRNFKADRKEDRDTQERRQWANLPKGNILCNNMALYHQCTADRLSVSLSNEYYFLSCTKLKPIPSAKTYSVCTTPALYRPKTDKKCPLETQSCRPAGYVRDLTNRGRVRAMEFLRR